MKNHEKVTEDLIIKLRKVEIFNILYDESGLQEYVPNTIS